MKRGEIPSFDAPYHLFGYMNVYLQEMPNDAHVVQYYLSEEPRRVADEARAELDQLLALPLAENELKEVLERRIRSRVWMQGFGLTPREWLERLRDLESRETSECPD